MNAVQKRRALIEAQIISNQRCQICGVLAEQDNVCGQCLEEDTLACFCDNHKERHRHERFHIANWQKLGGED